MIATTKDSTRPTRPRPVDELSEDLDVAIREFLERNPHTSVRRIRQALSLAQRRTGGRVVRRLAPAVTILVAFLVGLALGFSLP